MNNSHDEPMMDRDALNNGAGDHGGMADFRPIPRISIQAFCETEGVYKPIERASNDRRLAKAHVKTHMGGLEKAIEFYQSAPTPNLIIVESKLQPEPLFNALGALAEVCDPTTKVVVLGHYNDVNLYRELVKSGVSEYIVAPISMADVLGAITSIFVDPEAEPLGKSYAVLGAKGGVGASTIAHNLAWTISETFRSETIIADMDLPFGTANIDFDQDPPQGMSEAVFSPERIDDVYLDRLLVKCSDHLSLLAAPSTLERAYDFEGDAFIKLLDTVQRMAPVVVLDMPHTWNDWTRKTLAHVDEIVIVSTPELAALRNTKNLVDTLAALRPNDKAPLLVLNQIGVPKRPEISVLNFAGPLQLMPAAEIPFDPQLFGTASNNAQMVGEVDVENPATQAIVELAHIITGRSEIKVPKKSGLDSILSRFTKKKSA